MDKKTALKKIVTEHWFSVDYLILGNTPDKVLDEDARKVYTNAKTALLSNVADIYRFFGYTKEVFPYNNTNEMFDYIGDNVDLIKEDVAALIKTPEQIKLLKEEMGGVSEDNASDVKQAISDKFKNYSLDRLLLNDCFDMYGSPEKVGNFNFKILIDSHKILRSELVESILGAAVGAAVGLALGAAIFGALNIIDEFQHKYKSSDDFANKYKAAMENCKKITNVTRKNKCLGSTGKTVLKKLKSSSKWCPNSRCVDMVEQQKKKLEAAIEKYK